MTRSPPRGCRLARRACAVLLLATLVSGCERGVDALDDARERGVLEVVTRHGSTTLFEGRDGAEGFEHDLTRAFAAHLGLEVRYLVQDSIPAVLAAIDAGEGHLAAAALTRTAERERRFRFGPDYKEVQQQVVCHRDGAAPQSVADLVGLDLLVLGGSSYEERLRELRAEHPALRWRTSAELSTAEILERVWRRDADCTLADSNLVAINRRYYPELHVAFAISDPQQLAWVLPQRSDKLAAALEEWFAEAQASGLLERLDERHFGHVDVFDYVDLREYRQRIAERLPAYEPLFRAAAERHGLPWTVLAALAYQESHWNPSARSPTGVRGMMMLTRRTARSLGVQNRLDARESIMGGARYLERMLKRVPDSVIGPDRLWFALAAYNVGFGHLRDARVLAQRLGRDPDTWRDLKEVLPLLSRKQYYTTLKHGYARGGEPVRYVERVRNYLDILEQRLPEVTPLPDRAPAGS